MKSNKNAEFGNVPEEIETIFEESRHAIGAMNIEYSSHNKSPNYTMVVTTESEIYYKKALDQWFFKISVKGNYPKQSHRNFAIYTNGMALGVYVDGHFNAFDVEMQLSDPSTSIMEELPKLIAKVIDINLEHKLQVAQLGLAAAGAKVRDLERRIASSDIGVKIGGG